MTEQIDEQRFAEGSLTDPEVVRTFALSAARTLRDNKCDDIVLLDVRGLSHVTDYVVIGSGTSQRQMGSALQHVEDMAKESNFARVHTSRDDQSLWLLADFVDVVVHLFEPNTRAYYDLEMLWGDAPRVEWNDKAEP